MLKHSRRGGFTKLELAIVIVVGIGLFCLFMPSLPHGREAPRRTQCFSNMKTIGLALLSFEVRVKSLPPGLPNCKTENFFQVEGDSSADCQGPNWLSQILSDIEEKRYYDDLLRCLEDDTIKNACNDCPQKTINRVGSITPPVFKCPSSPVTGTDYKFKKYGVPADNLEADIYLSKGSYAANFGAESYVSSLTNPELAGMFEVVPIEPPANPKNKRWMMGSNKGTRISDILDGSSKTILVSEILGVDSTADARGVWSWPGMGGSSFTSYQTPNAATPDALPICDPTPSLYKDVHDPIRCTKEYRTNGVSVPRSAP